MKRIIYTLFVLFLLLPVSFTQAQTKEINSKSDLPFFTISTDVLKTGDTSLINVWIKNSAGKELKLIDSILINYNVSNTRVKSELIRRKALCSFILGKWDDMQNFDTVLKDFSQLPEGLRKAGFAELASYAKAGLQSSAAGNNDFKEAYIRFFEKSMQPLSLDEKIKFAGSAISNIGKAENLYEDEIKKLTAFTSVQDSALLKLFQGYVYMQLIPNVHIALQNYIRETIAGSFTEADSTRGTLTPERDWWNVLRYDITIKPDYTAKSISGKNNLQYNVTRADHPLIMQIDLQSPMMIDSIIFNSYNKLDFKSYGNAWYVSVPEQSKSDVNDLMIYFHGVPREAKNPPWDGGWVWKKDSLGNPWMSVACQGLGASVWYPCKDHQSDEPDNGASLTMIVPDNLVGVSNGRLKSKEVNSDGTASYKWEVTSPINSYNIIPNIGKYVNFKDEYEGENGKLDLEFWVLDYNYEKAKNYLLPEAERMLKAFEHWFGPYPFYEDSYKLIDAPYAGMEHQSGIAYGNRYLKGYWGNDLSGTKWGLNWDYMIVHESGHEWFGNNITTNDIADMWVHEGFTCYSETLFTEYWYGKEAGNEYNFGPRKNIQNSLPIIGFYGVNNESSSPDMYPKGSNMIHTIRNSMGDDIKFRALLRDLNKTFYHRTVTSQQIEDFINQNSGFDYSKVFDQYLRNVQIPKLEFYFSNDKKIVYYRYTNCVSGFDLPLVLEDNNLQLKIFPTQDWSSKEIGPMEAVLFTPEHIEKMYYIDVRESPGS